MTRYQCSKGHVFIHPAKLSVSTNELEKVTGSLFESAITMAETSEFFPEHEHWEDLKRTIREIKSRLEEEIVDAGTIEKSVCPFCQSLEYAEYTEPELQVEAVYVYDLTTGPQTELAGLLAQGYTIKNRYAKQYILEKLKEEKTQ